MKKAILVCAKRRHADALNVVRELREWANKKGFDLFDVTDQKGPIPSRSLGHVTVGAVIGGDGTFLSLVRRLPEKDLFPLIGINLGSLGFITEFSQKELFSAIEEVLKRKHIEARCPLLEVELWRGNKRVESGTVFNDAVLSKDPRTTMIKFDVNIGGEYLSHLKSDGYIVSTPTGSTAYALSVGGPLVHPELRALELVPMSSHALSARPIVIPDNMPIDMEIKELNGLAYLVYDGQVTVKIKKGDRIHVRLAKSSLRLVRSRNQKWPQALRSKLGMT